MNYKAPLTILFTAILSIVGCSQLDSDSQADSSDNSAGAEISAFSINLIANQPTFASRGETAITMTDVDDFLKSVVPAEDRPGYLRNPERIGDLTDNLLVREAAVNLFLGMSSNARESAESRIRYQVKQLLEEVYLEHLVDQKALDDYEPAARETFLKDPLLFSRGNPTYDFYSLVVPVSEVAEEISAIETVLSVQDAIDEGASFDVLLEQFANDEGDQSNRKFEGIAAQQLLPEIAALLESSERVIAGPLRTAFGWHFVQLVEKHPPEPSPFEDVRQQFMTYAQDRHEASIKESFARTVLREEIVFPPGVIEELLDRYVPNNDS